MRLLIVSFDPPENVGGVEGRASAYTKELTEMGNFIELIVLAPNYDFSTTDFHGVPLKRYPSSFTKVASSFRAAVREMNRKSIDSIFLLSGALTLFGNLLLLQAKLCHRRTLVFLYGKDLLSSRSNPFRQLMVLVACLLSDGVATNSRFTAALTPRMAANKVAILYPGVDPETAEGHVKTNQAHSRRILFVGRLVDRKGIDDLFRAFQMIHQKIPDSKVEIVGDGPERKKLEALAQRLGISSQVLFRGELTGRPLYEAYARASIVVGPSRSSRVDAEGFGTVFIEAGLFGKACLGTKSGGIPDAIQDGKTGMLVPESNLQALGESMLFLLTNEALRMKLGESGRTRVLEHFTWRKSATRLLELLELRSQN